MRHIFLGVLLVEVASVLAERNCDKLGVRVYEDMACRPKYSRCFRECPEEFICPNLHESTTECYYKNLTIKIGESLRHPDQLCDLACFCSEERKFICAIVDCAEYFGITPPPGCYNTYDLHSCCAVDKKCGESNVTCTYGGETYKEGIRFYPKDTCSMCVCQKGFRGKIEAPFCTRSKCNVQIHGGDGPQRRCAPVYNLYGNSRTNNDILCCPSDWLCPSGNETILGTAKSDKTCFFGDRKLKVGQRIESKIHSIAITCECKIPPLLTCIPRH